MEDTFEGKPFLIPVLIDTKLIDYMPNSVCSLLLNCLNAVIKNKHNVFPRIRYDGNYSFLKLENVEIFI